MDKIINAFNIVASIRGVFLLQLAVRQSHIDQLYAMQYHNNQPDSPQQQTGSLVNNIEPIDSNLEETHSNSIHNNINQQGQQQLLNNHTNEEPTGPSPTQSQHRPQQQSNPGDVIIASRLVSTGSTLSAQLASIHSLHPQRDLKLNNRFMLMPINDQICELQTVIRDKETSRGNFKFYADRLIRLVVEEGLNQLPIEQIQVITPTGNMFQGIRYLKGNCGVSIVRSGESMEQGLRDCCRSIRIGKILIESDENNQARVLYTKFPPDIAYRKILLLYPIMSTGLAVIESVRVLLSHGVKEDNLILLNLFSSPRAAKLINKNFPKMFALTSDINPVSPNHFGQRYFGTD